MISARPSFKFSSQSRGSRVLWKPPTTPTFGEPGLNRIRSIFVARRRAHGGFVMLNVQHTQIQKCQRSRATARIHRQQRLTDLIKMLFNRDGHCPPAQYLNVEQSAEDHVHAFPPATIIVATKTTSRTALIVSSSNPRIMQPVKYLSDTETLHSAMTHSLDRFQHLTEVNTPPNHCERSELRPVISESASQLSDLNKILAEATQTVNSVKQRVDEITFVLNSAKKITHPLRSVPNEILCLIFAHRWRRLVLSFPSLWTTPRFDLTGHEMTRRVQQQTVYLLTLYIERSRALPLDVAVRVMDDWIGHHAFRHIIQATTPRWKSAVLDLPLSEIFLFKGCTFPLLESVKIQGRYADIANEQDVDVFLSPPLLRSIAITSSLTLEVISMPWSQIVQYDCEYHAFSMENLGVLRQMTSLRYLVAYIVVGFSLEVVEPVVLASLTHLELSVAGATRPDDINPSVYLALLRMPLRLLSHFTLNYCEPDALCPVSFHPDFPSVKYLGLHLDLTSINAENFVHFLSFMDGVEELALSGDIISDKLLEVLTPCEDGMLVVPRLRVLDIHNADYSLTNENDPILPSPLSFHNMLLSRSRAHKRLIFTLEEFRASLAWRDVNHRAVALRDEDSRRWEQVRAAISVVYLEPDAFAEEESEHDTEHWNVWDASDDS
ncbi:hypothetical protein BDZ89DRAFT_1243580 [Hymenopellis radicata]|nr:hypothetical protein BDZ89DRAFT_1243580 [Hymenopellis radicata]